MYLFYSFEKEIFAKKIFNGVCFDYSVHEKGYGRKTYVGIALY